ncbi:caspase family protein [Dyadobacter jiangsuensis]|uniref:Caspase domain-containing protein n=1 Tax=Dyadobacter jiangsuensis TaxID=1591085 RepID=A0A2P8G0F0_9BACT|nr:caspase family protein [Dyadobacter jiangsuensis]PSL27447.1 caspase domain-containing protein [Dyadobacter jiangsuensis]
MKATFLIVLVFAGLSVRAQKIHLFFLADPSDKLSVKDRSEMENFWKYAGPYLDYPVSTRTLNNKEDLLSQIKKTTVAVSKDIIVFYYSGKGEAASDKVWPVMKAGADEVPMREVMEILRPKKAHLTLVIADCDNQSEPAYISRLVPRPHPPTLRESAQQLFLGKLECKRMFIKIASASPGQRAMRDKNGNSLFLATFLTALKEQMTDPSPRWGLNRAENTVKASLQEKLKVLTSGAQQARLGIDCPASIDDDQAEE